MAEDTKKANPTEVSTVTLTIDGQTVTVPKGTTVLKAATSAGIHIPTFCWHPKLKPMGSCRMCYVEIEKRPKLEVSCATEAMDGMVVQTNSDKVKEGRKAVLEFLLLNHPLDCPTCDQAGECELQDQTFAYGTDNSRYDFKKTRFVEEGMTTTFDDLRIGPEIILNRNRCILCYRCVRANKEAFGEYDLGVYERGNIAQITPAPGQEVDNPFSGNLVENCPVGALTGADWRYKIRVWLTETVPSICNFTSSGTNIQFYKDKHKNHIYRVTSRCNDDIDDGWLADVSRYSYQVVTSPDRLATPLARKGGEQVPVSWNEAIDMICKQFNKIKQKKGRVCIGGLAASNLDNMSLYDFSKFFRTVLNSNNVDFRYDYPLLPIGSDSVFSRLCSRPFKIADIDNSDVIVVFGSDMIREHPNEYLRIRKARNFGQPRIYVMNPYSTKVADIADIELVFKPNSDEILLSGLCLVAVEEGLVETSAGEEIRAKLPWGTVSEAASLCGVDEKALRIIARALADGRKITFIIGELVAGSKDREIIAAGIANLNRLFGLDRKGQLAVLARYANSRGAEKLGVLPEPPTAVKEQLKTIWGEFPDSQGNNTDSMLALMKKEEISGCFVLGSNPVAMYPDREFAREGIEKLEFLVACDVFETETTALADVVLPLSSWAEYDGDYINLEGRVQTAQGVVNSIGKSKPAYEIIGMIAEKLGTQVCSSTDKLTSEINTLLEVDSIQSLPDEFIEVKHNNEDIDQEFPLPLFVCDDPHHKGYLTEKSASLTCFAGEAYVELSPDIASQYGLTDGSLVRLESKVGKIIVAARISEHLDNDVLLIPRNFSSTPVTSLLMRKKRVDRVKISKADK
ncbi:MAG: NADH-quinone oxidoreductase subunit NuoG [candidate division Zixibacteria bacterium]|nr:NADH-quinone oxidoreductase subunit NuoG [candidate division Zixibacteria bacterium]